MKHKTKIISYEHQVRFFWILVVISVLSLFVYIYAINATARHVALRQGLERRMTDASARLDALEFAYIALKSNITIELAHQYGFREVKNPLYISRARPVSLSLNTLDR